MTTSGPTTRPRPSSQYEYRTVRFDRGTSVGDARQVITDEAERGRWELFRTVLYMGGERRVQLRRRIIRVQSTL